MANNTAFQPTGKTVKIATTTGAANNITFSSDSPSNQYRIANFSGNAAYVWISTTANPTNVAIPTGNGAGAGYSIVMPANTVSIISGPQVSSSTSVQVSAQAAAGTPDIFVTPGEGIL